MEFEYSDRLKNLEGNAIREIFKLLADPEVISFAGGFPTKALLPKEQIKEITDFLMDSSEAEEILQYGATEGYMPLRITALDYLKRYGIVNQKIENTLIISGGQQAIDLMCKAFLNKGDVVLVENPTYLAALHIIKTYEAKAIGVDSDEDGLNIEDLENKIKKYKPKFLYCVPTFSNPTGRTYSVEKRREIARVTAKYNMAVLEDDPYSELRFSGDRVVSMKSCAVDDNVIYATSFSKTLAPGLRTGIVVGNTDIIRKLTIGKQAVDVHTSSLSQAIINEFLKRGLMEPRLKEIIPVYKEKKVAMMNGIKNYMPDCFKHTNPDGGLFIFGEFPKECGINTLELFPAIAREKVAYVSGHSFYASEDVFNTMRLNYSNASIEQIDIGMKRMGDFFKKTLSDNKR